MITCCLLSEAVYTCYGPRYKEHVFTSRSLDFLIKSDNQNNGRLRCGFHKFVETPGHYNFILCAGNSYSRLCFFLSAYFDQNILYKPRVEVFSCNLKQINFTSREISIIVVL